MQPALQDEPRRSRGVLGPSVAENRPNTDPNIFGQTAFRYPISRARLGESLIAGRGQPDQGDLPKARPRLPRGAEAPSTDDMLLRVTVGAVWAPINKYICYYFGGPTSPQKRLPGTRNRPLGPSNEVPEPSRTSPESAKIRKNEK